MGNILQYLLWAGGGLLGLYAVKTIVSSKPEGGGSGAATVAAPMPIFMSGSGGLASNQPPLPNPVLGGDVWEPTVVPLSENPDVRIAEINADVAKNYLLAQVEIAKQGLSKIVPEVSQTNAVGGANQKGNLLPYEFGQTLDQRQPHPPVDVGGAFNIAPKVALTDAVAFVKANLQQGTAGLYNIYDQAAARGYTAAETASIINRAGGSATPVTAVDVNNWTYNQGVASLNRPVDSRVLINSLKK